MVLGVIYGEFINKKITRQLCWYITNFIGDEMFEKGRRYLIKENGLRATDKSQGMTGLIMMGMQGSIYRATNISDDGIRLNGFWFDKHDVISPNAKTEKAPQIVHFDLNDLVV